GKYDLIFFLGILYHLKNPFYALESLAKVTRHMLISTRVAKLSPAGRSMRDLPVAYLLHPPSPTTIPQISGSSPSPDCCVCAIARDGTCGCTIVWAKRKSPIPRETIATSASSPC